MTDTLGLGALIVVGFVVLGLLLARQRKSAPGPAPESLLLLNQNLQGMQQRIDETTRAINTRLDHAAVVIGGVQKDLGTMTEIGRNLKDFQDLLKSPKLRGNLGETILADTLAQFFPQDHFELQYKFASGEKVDAILRTASGLIPIDAKFPLENFRVYAAAESDEARAGARTLFLRDVKKHINDISKKYVLPAEGTLDFALMYVPAEAVFAEISLDQELMAHAHSQHVLPVSPNIFHYFLKTIMTGLEKQKLQESAQAIYELMKALRQDTAKFGEVLGVATTHITNAKNAVDRVNTEYTKLASKVDNVRLLK